MRATLPAAALLALGIGTASAPARADEDTRQAWIEACDPNGTQAAITACAVVEAARVTDLLEAVLTEIHDTYAGHDIADAIVHLPAAQEGWKAQMKADIDARLPLVDGQAATVTWGSSYQMRVELLRSALTRQRIAFLCEAWLPSQVRRQLPHDPPSVCTNLGEATTSAGAAAPD